MKNEGGILSTMAAAIIALAFLTLHMGIRYVLWPILRFVARMLLKGMQKGGAAAWAKFKAPKLKPVLCELPTPDVFKGMPNLAPAKELHLR